MSTGIYFPVVRASGQVAHVVFPEPLFDPLRQPGDLSEELETCLRANSRDWDLPGMMKLMPILPEAVVRDLLIRRGDLLDLDVSRNVLSVFGNPDLDAAKHRPGMLSDIRRKFLVSYPRNVIPLGRSGDPQLRVLMAQCAPGEGGLNLLVGPTGSGKSTMSRKIAHAVLGCIEDGVIFSPEDTIVIWVGADERDADYRRTLEVLTAHPKVPWRYFAGFGSLDVTYNLQIAFEMAQRYVELGKKVVIFWDSVHGAVAKFSEVNGKPGAAAGAGVDRTALNIVKNMALLAGCVVGSPASLTIIATCTTSATQKSTAAEIILQEIAEGRETTIARFFRSEDTQLSHPWLDSVSRARETDEMFARDEVSREAFHFIQARLATMDPERRIPLLKEMFSSGAEFTRASMEAWFKAQEAKTTANGWLRYQERVIAAAASLAKLQHHQKLAALMGLMEQGGMGKFTEALVLLVKLCQQSVRDEFFALLGKEEGLMPKPDPAEAIVRLAESLSGSAGLKDLLRKVIIAAGLTVDELLVAEGDEALVDEIFRAFQGQFKRKVASQLVAAGYIDVEELRVLLKSTTPKALIAKPRRTG